jgi:hypothetical protein
MFETVVAKRQIEKSLLAILGAVISHYIADFVKAVI